MFHTGLYHGVRYANICSSMMILRFGTTMCRHLLLSYWPWIWMSCWICLWRMPQSLKMHSSMNHPWYLDYSRGPWERHALLCYKVMGFQNSQSLAKTKLQSTESFYLNFHSAKCHYAAVQPSKTEPHSSKSPHSYCEAAEFRQPSAPQTITR